MTKYRDHWEQALTEIEEWRLARNEYRRRPHGSRLAPEANDDSLEVEDESPIQARFRRRHPFKEPVTIHSIVFVNQSALYFGSNAVPPRRRRPVFVLRVEADGVTILGAPLTSSSSDLTRKLPIPRDAVGLRWEKARPVDLLLYDGPEFIPRKHIRKNDQDSPLAQVTSPLLQSVIAFVHGPAQSVVPVVDGSAS
jgi:hypothetical protein